MCRLSLCQELRKWLLRRLPRRCRRSPEEIIKGGTCKRFPLFCLYMNATAQLDGGNCYFCFFLRIVAIVMRTMVDKTSKHRRLMEMIIAYLATV